MKSRQVAADVSEANALFFGEVSVGLSSVHKSRDASFLNVI